MHVPRGQHNRKNMCVYAEFSNRVLFFGFLQKVDNALELFSDNVPVYDRTKTNIDEGYNGIKTNIDEGHEDIVIALKRKKRATLFEAYRIPKKMKINDLKNCLRVIQSVKLNCIKMRSLLTMYWQ